MGSCALAAIKAFVMIKRRKLFKKYQKVLCKKILFLKFIGKKMKALVFKGVGKIALDKVKNPVMKKYQKMS